MEKRSLLAITAVIVLSQLISSNVYGGTGFTRTVGGSLAGAVIGGMTGGKKGARVGAIVGGGAGLATTVIDSKRKKKKQALRQAQDEQGKEEAKQVYVVCEPQKSSNNQIVHSNQMAYCNQMAQQLADANDLILKLQKENGLLEQEIATVRAEHAILLCEKERLEASVETQKDKKKKLKQELKETKKELKKNNKKISKLEKSKKS